ncbi:MAG: hypothetical protein JXA81_04510 [Sedimentisphaerales bacterium]|nr:hypothetical protein [Sedimentisphaerales bacterium]
MSLSKTHRMGFSPPIPLILFIVTMLLTIPASSFAMSAVEWDFSTGLHGWTGNGRAENLSFSSEGLAVKSTGEDPWIEGPAVDLPDDKTIRVKVRMKSNADAGAELFYGRVFRAGDSVRFTTITDGQWHDYSLVIRDKLGPGTRFRLDPCTGAGNVTVAWIKIETISEIVVPSLPKPEEPGRNGTARASVKSGGLVFEHYGNTWGNFALKVNGMEMAAGYQSELLGLVFDEQPEWLNLNKANFTPDDPSTSRATFKDSKAGIWEIRRSIKPAKQQGTLTIEIELQVDKDRDIIHIPWLTIFPGLGMFGVHKDQGLFAGVEYLCDEPSSSEADIETPDHVRRVPDPVKITFPLIAIAHGGNYIGVIWEPSEIIAATFDSPDRIYNSGAHVIALSSPRIGNLRFENAFCAQVPLRLCANQPLKVTAMIIGGKGRSIVPSVQHYVALKGLPAEPQLEGGFDAAVGLLAHGWLDSQINEDSLFRHAVWGDNFPAGPAADAAMYIDWLANQTKNENLRERLSNEKSRVISKIPPGQPFSSCVSHAHLPNTPLLFGRMFDFVQQRRSQAYNLLRSFDANGVKLYRPGNTDYSKTHFAKHANGLAGRDMVTILEAATLSADKELIDRALKLLDKQTALYADTVPRGAQTWEVPLHTPDILASAHMVKAYALGYMISGRQEYLDQARYWAWTGVPFVYLQAPTSGRVGVYSTTAVLGATNWKAPLWIGLPVQWCGLVYGSALHTMNQFDPDGPWEKIANGITVTGLQMSWPHTDEQRQGLLPDSFDLKTQICAGPAINPGTVQAHMAELYGKGTIYDVKKLPGRGWFVHAPCIISNIREDKDCATFTVDGWGGKQFFVLISGIETEPSEILVNPDKSNTRRSSETQYDHEQKILLITVEGKSEIQIK